MPLADRKLLALRKGGKAPQAQPRPEWLVDFERRMGRPLRVLHIGNIANNAYNNARIQRQFGISADVICHDYYHVMGTPEWEDATIKGKLADAFFPDWWSVDLGNWSRPDWFVQGPRDLCLRYLWTRNLGRRRAARVLATSLVIEYWQMLARQAEQQGRQRPGSPFDRDHRWTSVRLCPGRFVSIRHAWSSLSQAEGRLDPITRALAFVITEGDTARLGFIVQEFMTQVVHVARLRSLQGTGSLVEGGLSRLYDWARRMLKWRPGLDPALLADKKALADDRPFRATIGSARFLARIAAWWVLSRLSRFIVGTDSVPFAESRKVVADRIARHHASVFPGLPDEDMAADVEQSTGIGWGWTGVLRQYDLIQAYSTDGQIPLANGVRDYLAYEHGTLREIPFEPTPRGRMCQTSYRKAAKVFVTNTDVLPSVERLEIPPDRVVHLPHAFNDAKVRAFRTDHPDLVPPQGPVRIFSPSRHHWRHGENSWLKGNDILLRAAARLAAEGRAFKLVLVEWGAEVDLSKALIDELSLKDHVEWVPTMTKAELWEAYCRSHVVVDQFVMPAIGGVGFEALTLGRRLISRIDEPTLERFFGACPPIMNASSVDDAEYQLRRVLDDPEDREGLGDAGPQWIRDYHSAERVVALQLEAYRDVLATREAAQRESGLDVASNR